MNEKRPNSKTRSASDGELIDVVDGDNFRNEDDDLSDQEVRTYTLPRQASRGRSKSKSKSKSKRGHHRKSYEIQTSDCEDGDPDGEGDGDGDPDGLPVNSSSNDRFVVTNAKNKPKNKVFRKGSVKSVGSMFQKFLRNLKPSLKFSMIVPTVNHSTFGGFNHHNHNHNHHGYGGGGGGGGNGNKYSSLRRQRHGSMSASTTDVRSLNGNNSESSLNKAHARTVSGLRNHGNTCFMNAVLQCLSHTDTLAEYFVMDQYKVDLTRRNKTISKKYGTRGEVTEQFALLLKSLWSCQYTPEISNQFKTVVGKYETQYQGSNQHDAQEFLLWLLDKVHEDLNMATKKKYKKIKSSHGRPDEVVAAEAMANHSRCNSSFVHYVFQALYRSSLTCPGCQRQTSITFDPFLCVSIPIPQRELRPIFVTVTYLSQKPKQVKLGLNVFSQATIRELREALSADTSIPEKQLILAELSDDGFHQTFHDNQSIGSCLPDDRNLYAIETPPLKKPLDEREAERLLLVWVNRLGVSSQGKRFGCPYVCEVFREATFEEIQKAILSTMSGILKEGLVQEKQLPRLRLRVVDGIPTKSYLPYDVPLPLYMPTVDQALGATTSMSSEQKSDNHDCTPPHLKLIVEWDEDIKNRLITSFEDFVQEHSSVTQLKNQQMQAATATLDECFQLYTQEEKLGPEDLWMCPNCKRPQQGVKKLGLWTVPDILIIHLKRFRQTATQRTKLNTLVEFPVSGLDMSNHIVTRDHDNHFNNNGVNALTYWSPWRRQRRQTARSDNLFDLYAVCNHHGNMQGGHYTACCKNPTEGNWYSFDDTKVTLLKDDAEIVTPNAYILFYQRSSTSHSGSTSSASSSSSATSDHWINRMPPFYYNPSKCSSKSQDNLSSLVGHEDGNFKTHLPKNQPFTRGARPYNSMAPLSNRKKDCEMMAEPDHCSDDESMARESRTEKQIYITESCV